MKLGEPDYVTEDGQRLGFAWTKVKAIWALIGQSSSLAGEVWHNYFLETSFDPATASQRCITRTGGACEVTVNEATRSCSLSWHSIVEWLNPLIPALLPVGR